MTAVVPEWHRKKYRCWHSGIATLRQATQWRHSRYAGEALHEMRIGRFHVGGERASRFNQSPDRDVL
ncbi:hypothetical protein [Xanthomonas campestris]|uniref:hypothetical protein n=1 Tax=Xanthomonas campestris TaxID=339 RepID=UPI002B231294|nr:hypothetical protein [Xanthomonas campestris]